MIKNQHNSALRDEVHRLAEEAFSQHLITGYGDGQYAGAYQIHLEGKPRHLSLEAARSLLWQRLQSAGHALASNRIWHR